MLATQNPQSLTKFIKQWKGDDKTIGLVPTMGALHDGHMALVDAARNKCDVIVVSLFVNPLQFNNPADLDKYPRDFDRDFELLEKAGVDMLFHPDDGSMISADQHVAIDFGGMDTVLEGAYRPGHFKGVGIIVSKLFHMVQPDIAFFGLKDLQQSLLIRKMVTDLSFPLTVETIDTVREADGLALSSRNRRLSDKGKKIACHLFRGLEMARKLIHEEESPKKVITHAREFYESVDGLEIEYLEMVDASNLSPLETYHKDQDLAVCVSAYVEGVRLIDNLYLRRQSKGQ